MAQVQGFPDYARLATQAGVQLGAISAAWNTNPNTGSMDCVGYGYLNITWDMVGGTSYGTIQVQFYSDPALTNLVSAELLTSGAGQRGSRQYPVKSRYCVVFAIFNTGLNTETVKLVVYGTNAYAPDLADRVKPGPQAFGHALIAAGGDARILCETTFNGVAFLWVHMGEGGGWAGYVEFWDTGTSAWVNMAGSISSSNPVNWTEQIVLPSAPVAIHWYNLDTIAHNFYAALTF